MSIDEPRGREPITIVAFGDSITAAVEQNPDGRWPRIVERELRLRFNEREMRVVNAGVGGNTTREGLARFERDVLEHRPTFVLAEFGNDATPDPDRHVPLDEFTANLDHIRVGAATHCGARLVLLTFPPIVDEWHAHFEHAFYRDSGGQDAYQERYRQRTRDFARSRGCVLVESAGALRDIMAAEGPASCILPDGVHLTARGNHVIADLLAQRLAELIATSLR